MFPTRPRVSTDRNKRKQTEGKVVVVKMKRIILALLILPPALANLDVVSLFTARDTWIQEVVATLVVGDVPNPITGDVALWTGIMTDKRDFLQGVTQNSQPRYFPFLSTPVSVPGVLIFGWQLLLRQPRAELVHLCV